MLLMYKCTAGFAQFCGFFASSKIYFRVWNILLSKIMIIRSLSELFYSTTNRKRTKTEPPTFIYGFLSSEKREALTIKRKVKAIREFLKKREKLEIAKAKELAHLKQHCKNRSIDEETCRKLKQLLKYTHERKRIDLIESVVEKNIRIDKAAVS